MNIADSPNCKMCDTDDSLIHYFIDCDRVQNFWNSFHHWWYALTNKLLLIESTIVIFGIPENTPEAQVLNFCLIMAKLHIYEFSVPYIIPVLLTNLCYFLSYLAC